MCLGVCHGGNLVQKYGRLFRSARPEVETATERLVFFPSGLLIKSVNWFQIGNMTEHENV